MDLRSRTTVLIRKAAFAFHLAMVVGLAAQQTVIAQIPVGSQFLVNSYTTSLQEEPAIAMEVDGDFVVTWYSYGSGGSDTSSTSIQGRLFSSGGNALGSQFQVNSYTSSVQTLPAVGLDSDGDFVIVWESYGPVDGDDSSSSIQGQRYSSDGSTLGNQFQVNTYTTYYQRAPGIAVHDNGDFVVVWASLGSDDGDDSGASIQGKRYSSDGGVIGSQFQVNTYTTSTQYAGTVAAAPGGDFVVVWNSDGSDGGDTSYFSIQGQRYSSDGTALGSQFQVNSFTTNRQLHPAVTVDQDGQVFVAWSSNGSNNGDTSFYSIQGQRYSSDGSTTGSQFLVNTYTTSNQFSPSVAVAADGEFVVTWSSDGSDGGDTSSFSIQGQRFSSAGDPLDPQFQVNSFTTSDQGAPVIAADADRNFVIVWGSDGSDNGDSSSRSVQGQRFTICDLFCDGFESGDVLAWSAASP